MTNFTGVSYYDFKIDYEDSDSSDTTRNTSFVYTI